MQITGSRLLLVRLHVCRQKSTFFEARSASFDVARRPCRCQKSGVGKKAGLLYDQIV